MAERKLATIRTVAEIRPIAGADKIELAVIDGWQCEGEAARFTALPRACTAAGQHSRVGR